MATSTTTRTSTTPAPTPAAAASRPGGPRLPRRATGRAALGLVVVLVGALAGTWLLTGASERAAVLVLARDVAYG